MNMDTQSKINRIIKVFHARIGKIDPKQAELQSKLLTLLDQACNLLANMDALTEESDSVINAACDDLDKNKESLLLDAIIFLEMMRSKNALLKRKKAGIALYSKLLNSIAASLNSEN